VKRLAFDQGNRAHSETSGPTSGPIAEDSVSVALIRQRIQDALNAAWWDLQRLAAVETPENRKAVEQTRNKLAVLVEAWEQFCGQGQPSAIERPIS